jgi:hypothetical protein
MSEPPSGDKVVASLIQNLKDSPLTLALVLFNLVFIGVIYFSLKDQRNHNETFRNELMAQQSKTMDMLYNCTPMPNRPSGEAK